MKCPYCGKRVGDMPNHLRKSPDCIWKHSQKLKTGLAYSLSEYLKKLGMAK